MSEEAATMRAPTRTAAFEARLKKRYAAERRFKAIGLGAIVFSIAVLVFLLGTMTINGIGGFQRVEVEVPIDFTQAGISAGASAPVHSRPTLVVWKPSTSLPGSMAAMTLASSMGSGRGN